jgi:type 2 lantibiotic biosynthesis protein LanM
MNKQLPFFSQIEKICNTQSFDIKFENNIASDEIKWLNDILWMSKFPLDHEWSLYRKKNTEEKYSSYSNKILNNFSTHFDAEKFIKKYPHLEELVFIKISSKQHHLKEVISSFEEDKEEIVTLFNFEKTICIKEINLGEGDVHQHGKSTAIVHLSNGHKIVYKPRSGALDQVFNALLEEINLAKIGVYFKRMNLLNKPTHSWAEYISQQPVQEEIQIKNYYKRCGALIALSYFLMGFDLHFENIIAHGEYPMLIDLECMFNSNDSRYNVLSIGLIPQLFSVNNKFFDASGLGANSMGETIPYWQWENINTDNLNLIKRSSTLKEEKNQLLFHKKTISPKKHLNEIIEGFQCLCNWFLEQKKENNIRYLLSGFKKKTIRILPRSTQLYSNILENSFLPAALKSSKERSKILDKYLHDFPLLPTIADEHKEQIRKGEKEALLRMDIPYFTANTSDTHLEESGQKLISNYFKKSPFDFVIDRINTFKKKDVQIQVNLIKNAFAARYNLQKDFTKSSNTSRNNTINIDEELAVIIEKILNTTSEVDGKYFWECYQTSATGKTFLGTLDNSLYSGTLGIALFLSEYLRKQKSTQIQHLINSLIEDLVLNFSKFLNNIDQSTYMSLSSGISGVIYTLLKIDTEKYKEVALQLTSLFTESVITNGKINDLLEGCSGALIVLIKLYRIHPTDELLNKIKLIGTTILKEKTLDESLGRCVWKSTINEKPLTGLAHGASGIAYAFLKLYELTKEVGYRNAFYEAVDFEDIYFSNKENNWNDVRNEKNNFHNAWCYGGIGIGLVRLHAYKILNDSRFLKDIRAVISLIQSEPHNNLDFYCCGNAGKIDFLLEAFTILKEDQILDLANKKIKELVQKKEREGNYITHEATALKTENPSLFRGLSGIGFVLLRSQTPYKYASIGLFN